MPTGKRYTDEEVHAIFERAALRQEAAREAEDASRAGLSLEELQQIGAESGIDPTHVAAAAHALTFRSADAATERSTFLGMPTRLSTERILPGPISDEAWERIVPELRRIFKQDGLSGGVGRVREWTLRGDGKGSGSDRPAKVTLTPDGHGTHVSIEQTMKGSVGGMLGGTGSFLFVPILIMVLNLLGEQDAPLGVALLFLAIFFAAFGAAWGGLRAYGRRQEERFEQALDRIEVISRQASPQPSPTSAVQPEIDLDALPDDPNAVPERSTTHQRERE